MAQASVWMKMAGRHMQAGSQMMQGMAAEEKAKFEAKQLRRNANAVEARGQRQAAAEREQGDLVKSSAVAQMAAGGGGVDSRMLADIQDKTDYNALAAIYESKTQANKLRDEARVRMQEGKQARRETRLSAVGSIFGGASDAAGSMSEIIDKQRGYSGASDA